VHVDGRTERIAERIDDADTPTVDLVFTYEEGVVGGGHFVEDDNPRIIDPVPFAEAVRLARAALESA